MSQHILAVHCQKGEAAQDFRKNFAKECQEIGLAVTFDTKSPHIMLVKGGSDCYDVIESLQSFRANSNFVKDIVPLHNDDERAHLKRMLLNVNFDFLRITQYFGTQVSLYLLFVHTYTVFLSVPAFFGALIYIFDTRIDGDVNGWSVVLYATGMILWSPVLMRYYLRRQSEVAFLCSHTLDQVPHQRPQFRGELSTQQSYLRFAFSLFVTLLFLLVALIIMVVFLNTDGYVKSSSPLYTTILNSRYPERAGLVSEEDYFFVQCIPTIMHSLCVLLLNMVYSEVAKRLTDYEGHRFEEEWDRSYILKRVPFELFDCFVSLFYLMLWERDVEKLRSELLGLFIADTSRRVIMESIVPFIIYRLAKNVARRREKVGQARPQHAKDFLKSHWDPFDDWIEVISQMAYVLWFSAIFPLASTLAFLSNVLELRSDMFKTLYVLRRPRYMKKTHIGIWYSVLSFICFFSVLTNAVLFGFTSDQVERLWIGQDARTIIGGHNATSLAIIIFIEHIGISLQIIIRTIIPAVPKEIRVALSIQRRRKKAE